MCWWFLAVVIDDYQMNDHHNTTMDALRLIASYLAALLGIGTFAGLVSISVGILSACWLAYQLYVAVKYELPIKRAKLEAARRGNLDSTQPGDLI